MLPYTVYAAGTINVEIDYMVESGAGPHTHKPTVAEMEAVKKMFACHGWTLNYVIDDALPHADVLQYSTSSGFFAYTGANDRFGELKADYFDNGAGWHYVIFGHQYEYPNSDGVVVSTGSSGLGEINGNDFLVTLGNFDNEVGTPWDRASTFAHELGHNLGLGHSGGTSGGGNYKPNYASIMSYQFQLRGVRQQLQCLGLVDDANLFKNLDYSNGRLPSINEASLVEANGVGIHKVDWDCDGDATGTVNKELDEVRPPWCTKDTTDTTRTVLSDANDWANIADSAGASAGGVEVQPTVISCITYDEVEAMRIEMSILPDTILNPANCPSGQPAVTSESCNLGQMIWVNAAYGGTETGTGDRPYDNLQQAHNAAPNGSTLYLQRGTTHSNAGIDFNLSKRVKLSGPGTAVVNP